MPDMTPERWRRIKEILDAALARSGTDRAAFLDEACRNDLALRREVDSLLARTSGADDFLERVSTGGVTRTYLAPPALETGTPGRELRLGHAFGGYRIERLLGRGGMGEVYAAEELESGRRLALKVLRSTKLDPSGRARFLREGRLAASISHPNVVYVFGTAEIEGMPVIAMELASGGSLKDRVRTGGPLPPTEAVDALLDVIAGLETAAEAGILHRDIKPANCFVDREGRVKIGDFGLSISTLARGETALTAAGTFMGTPAFAAPEQLRGESLDVRTDIYAVGATLCFLLTARTRFEGDEFFQLAVRIANEQPASPRALQPSVPRELDAVVLRCLAKNRESRYRSYSALREALEPFASSARVAPRIGVRAVAGVLDLCLVWIVSAFLIPGLIVRTIGRTALILPPQPAADSSTMVLGGLPAWLRWLFPAGAGATPLIAQPHFGMLVTIAQALSAMAYFAVLEGSWRCSIGKAACGLRVGALTGGTASAPEAVTRALLFVASSWALAAALVLMVPGYSNFQRLPFIVAFFPSLRVGSDPGAVFLVLACLILFVTARRENACAGLHDLLSRTRVVLARVRVADRARVASLPTRETVPTGSRRIGPYAVVADSAVPAPPAIVVGFDESLGRHVWIHLRPVAAAAVSDRRRDLDRPARLRWLAGSRTELTRWDAYEAPMGQPAATLSAGSWAVVRRSVGVIATELRAALDDGTLESFSQSQLWIGADGRVLVLDWPADASDHSVETTASHAVDFRHAQQVLRHFAMSSIEGSPDPQLPLSARQFFRTLEHGRFQRPAALEAAARQLTAPTLSSSRWRRVAHLAVCSALGALIVAAIAAWAGLRSRESTTSLQRAGANVPMSLLADSLNYLLTLDLWERQSANEGIVERRQALETYINARFRKTMQDAMGSADPIARSLRSPVLRARAQEVFGRPAPSSEDLAKAENILQPVLAGLERSERMIATRRLFQEQSELLRRRTLAAGVAALVATLFGVLIFPAVFRGGLLLRCLGFAVITGEGIEASRLRALARALVAWVPALTFGTGMMVQQSRMSWLALAGLTGMAVGAAWIICRPDRGPQDWVTGTWVVPR